MVSKRTIWKLQELAIRHGVPEFGIPYLTIIKRIVDGSNNLAKEEEETLRSVCKEMGVDYDTTFKKRKEKVAK